MMPELSLNILDVTQNSVTAGASLIRISISASTAELSRQLGIGLRRTQTLLRELRQEQLIVSNLHAGTHRLPR